jgi:hypothetical protein
LRQHAQQRRTQQERLDALVGQAGHACRVVGVQGGQYQVARSDAWMAIDAVS